MEINFNDVIISNSLPININLKSNNIACFLGNDDSIGSDILKSIMAIIKPKSGHIKVDNKYVYNNKRTGLNTLRSEILYLGDEVLSNIFLDKVMDIFELSIKLYNVEDIDIIKLLDSFYLDESIIYNKIDDISESEKVIVMLLAGIIKKPKIIIIDNIFSFLDYDLQRKLINFLKKIKMNSDTIIVVNTNDSELALKIGDDVFITSNNDVVISGMKYEVFQNKEVLSEQNINIPNVIDFENLVYETKGIKLGYRDEINDLIKDIYRHVR